MSIPKWLKTEIDELFEKDKNPSLSAIKNIVDSKDSKLSSRINRYSKMKTYIKNTYKDVPEKILKDIKATKEETDTLVSQQLNRRQKRDNFVFSQSDVDTILSFGSSSNVYKILIYLQFTSGRRINEVLKSDFQAVPRKTNMLQSSNLSKKPRDDSGSVDRFSLIDIKAKAWLKLRKKLLSLMPDDSVSDITRTLNKSIKKWLDRSDISSHTLRGMYGMYMWCKFDKKKQNINGYLTEVLNHHSPETSLAYSRYVFEEK